MSDSQPLIEVQGLKKYFAQETGVIQRLLGRTEKQIKAVDDVSFTIEKRSITGIIGESGCGKSTLLLTLARLLPPTDGDIRYRGESILDFDKRQRLQFHRNVQLIFQDPFNSLNPKMNVRELLREPLSIHGFEDKEERIHEVLETVQLSPPERYIDKTPGALSGGEKQRVSIARALILEPDVILADEPVSMLDVSTQAAILNLLARLAHDLDIAILYISHDISTVSFLCDEINVMYLGRIVETAPTETIIEDPKHPYTEALMSAIPILNPHHDRPRTQLEGSTPDPINVGDGCRFRDRCPERMDVCDITPDFVQVDQDHETACHLYYDHREVHREDVSNGHSIGSQEIEQ